VLRCSRQGGEGGCLKEGEIKSCSF
jgi:hypothetical protein